MIGAVSQHIISIFVNDSNRLTLLNVFLISSEEFVMIVLVDAMFRNILSAKVMWRLFE